MGLPRILVVKVGPSPLVLEYSCLMKVTVVHVNDVNGPLCGTDFVLPCPLQVYSIRNGTNTLSNANPCTSGPDAGTRTLPACRASLRGRLSCGDQ